MLGSALAEPPAADRRRGRRPAARLGHAGGLAERARGDSGGACDHAGLPVLRHYLVYRALVPKRFGGLVAVSDVSFEVQAGDVLNRRIDEHAYPANAGGKLPQKTRRQLVPHITA